MNPASFTEFISDKMFRRSGNSTFRTRAQRKIYPRLTIGQLPNEILIRIFRQLPQYAILSATLVCRQWNALIAASDLLDSFTLRIVTDEESEGSLVYGHQSEMSYGAAAPDERSSEYVYYLNRSVRTYRAMDIHVDDHHMVLVAVLALRKFGGELKELRITLDMRSYSSYFQLHFERLKELELGLEEHGQMLWEQEVDSYDNCLRPVAVSAKKDFKQSSFEEELRQDFRRVEEVFLCLVYRYCPRLKTLVIHRWRNIKDMRAQVLLYEGAEMEQLAELAIRGTGFIVLADSPQLRQLTIQGVTTGQPFYHSFRYAFPNLTQLEIINDEAFDDMCLWVISKRCTRLVELSLLFDTKQISKQAFLHIDRLRNLKKLSVSLQGPKQSLDHTFTRWPPTTIERLFISTRELSDDTIGELLATNQNLVEFVLNTTRSIAYETLCRLQQKKPSCRLTCRQSMTTSAMQCEPDYR